MFNTININLTANTHLQNAKNQRKKLQDTNFNPLRDKNTPIVLKYDALHTMALRLPGGGMVNLHVFKADSFTPSNPVMLVKGTNTDGSPFEAYINVNELNKSSMSIVDMAALDGYLRANGKPGDITRAATLALINSDIVADAFTQFNILPSLKEALAVQRHHHNWKSVAWFDSVINKIINHFTDR